MAIIRAEYDASLTGGRTFKNGSLEKLKQRTML